MDVKARFLDHSVLQSLRDIPDDPSMARRPQFSGDALFSAINLAGDHLRYAPDRALLSTPVELTSEQQSSFAANVLKTMINSSIDRIVDDSLPQFFCTNPQARNACYDAEYKFAVALRRYDPKFWDTTLADIVLKDGEPILIRKHNGALTSLTLQDLTIDGIPYPAGSLTSARFENDPEYDFLIDRRGENGPIYRLYDSDQVSSLGFLRLTMFAMPLEQRELWPSYDTEAVDRISTLDIPTIQTRVRKMAKTAKKLSRRTE